MYMNAYLFSRLAAVCWSGCYGHITPRWLAAQHDNLKTRGINIYRLKMKKILLFIATADFLLHLVPISNHAINIRSPMGHVNLAALTGCSQIL